MTEQTPEVEKLEVEGKNPLVGTAARAIVLKELEKDGSFPFYGFIRNETKLSALVFFKDMASYYGVLFAEANKVTGYDKAKEHFFEDKVYTGWLPEVLDELGIPINENWQKVIDHMDYVFQINGIRWNSGIHASGVIMSKKSDVNLPIDENHVLAYNGHNLEEIGYIKYDLLSVDVMNVIQYFYGNDIDWTDVDDPKVWETIQNGDTDYIFQFGAPQMQSTLRSAGDTIANIETLSELNAINRPGPLGMGVLDKWLRMLKQGKHDRKMAELKKSGEYDEEKDRQFQRLELSNEEQGLARLLKREFEDSTGLVIYQENVMKICEIGAGFTLSETDNIRKAMGKKKKDLLESYHKQFVENWKYPEIIEIDGLGVFLRDDKFTLVTGETITAIDLYDRVQSGEELEIIDN